MDDKNKKAVEIYDSIAEDYAKKYDPIDGEEDLIFLNTFLSYLNSGSFIADIGCGTGFSSGYFTKKGMETEGSDLSSSMIAIARRNYPSLHFSVADMREFCPAKMADAVWAGYSLFHFGRDDFEKTIETVKSYLKPGGIFGLVMQEGEGEVEPTEPFLPSQTIYIHLYMEDEIKSILEKYGFTVVKQQRKTAKNPGEFSFNKILSIAKFIG